MKPLQGPCQSYSIILNATVMDDNGREARQTALEGVAVQSDSRSVLHFSGAAPADCAADKSVRRRRRGKAAAEEEESTNRTETTTTTESVEDGLRGIEDILAIGNTGGETTTDATGRQE